MRKCKILTLADIQLIPQYVEILNSGLNKLMPIDRTGEIARAKLQYSPDYLRRNLSPGSEKRLVGHFAGDSLDGILIEDQSTIDFENNGAENNITMISWLVAQQERQGIGDELVKDCIKRAYGDKKDAVCLNVFEQNIGAIRLYTRNGFHENGRQNGSIGMYYYINPRMNPANWSGNKYIGP